MLKQSYVAVIKSPPSFFSQCSTYSGRCMDYHRINEYSEKHKVLAQKLTDQERGNGLMRKTLKKMHFLFLLNSISSRENIYKRIGI